MLFLNGRWANADQLYGFSAECGLKTVMQALGMPVDATGTPQADYKKHVQDLWPAFPTFVDGRRGARYASLLPSCNPFQNWTHTDRYAHSSHFSRTQVGPHRWGPRVT